LAEEGDTNLIAASRKHAIEFIHVWKVLFLQVLKLFKQSTEQNKNHDTVMNLTYDDPCNALSLYDGNRTTASASQTHP
jgi:hypothetical protein